MSFFIKQTPKEAVKTFFSTLWRLSPAVFVLVFVSGLPRHFYDLPPERLGWLAVGAVAYFMGLTNSIMAVCALIVLGLLNQETARYLFEAYAPSSILTGCCTCILVYHFHLAWKQTQNT